MNTNIWISTVVFRDTRQLAMQLAILRFTSMILTMILQTVIRGV